METTTSIVEVRLSSPTLLGGNKVSERQIRETIILSSGAWVGIESKGLIRVNSTLYNLKYYDLVGSDSTQKATIQKALKQLFPHTSKIIDTSKTVSTNHTVDYELKQLDILTSLCKKLNAYHKATDKATTEKDENKTILLERRLQKDKAIIHNYLKTLKADPSFTIQGIKALYKGQYVQASKVINLGGF
jgi:hypothetical protein